MDSIKYKQRENIITRVEDDEFFLFDPDSAQFMVLNETSGFIWNKCLDAVSVEDIISCMLNEYDVDETTLRNGEVEKNIEKLCEQGFITKI